jgi:hypothetical protein
MRIAWFRDATPDTTDALDAGAALIDQLRSSHDIDVIVERDAHDFVWQQFLRPWDLCVYELDTTRAHGFIWAYLINYPGVVMLRSTDLAHLRVPLLASRSVVTSNAANAERLRAGYPEVHVRVAPICGGPTGSTPHLESDADPTGPRATRIAVFDRRPWDGAVVERAIQRARDAGAAFELLEPSPDVVAACDVVIAPGWPPFHDAPTALLAGMAAGKAVVTTEMDGTAEWPAMDPQTWRPRGIAVSDPPIAVTIDPRDEEHSLMLAIRRLSSDAVLREQLGRAGHQWWKSHATPAHAAAAWEQILEEAVRLSPPPRPDDWPKQFAEDGTELAREILNEFGLPPTDTLARS